MNNQTSAHGVGAASMVVVLTVTTVMCPLRASAQEPDSTREDYLSSELRQRVELLKQALPSQPSSSENGWERGNLVWEWANAYALSGGTLPVELPAIMAQIMSRRGKGIGRGNLEWMDSFIRELQLRDEQPLAIGKLTSTAERISEAAAIIAAER
jgi:hypothetical protein